MTGLLLYLILACSGRVHHVNENHYDKIVKVKRDDYVVICSKNLTRSEAAGDIKLSGHENKRIYKITRNVNIIVEDNRIYFIQFFIKE